MSGADTITNRQVACIKGLSTRIGRPVPTGLDSMCRKEASEHIESLLGELKGGGAFQSADSIEQQQLQVEPHAASSSRLLSRDERIRLGLAVKLVYQRWTSKDKVVLQCRDEFKKDVKQLFLLLAEVEDAVWRGGAVS